MENCGGAIINTIYKNGDARGAKMDGPFQKAIFCIHCQIGYRAIDNFPFSFIKKSCEYIENCVGRDWIDACSECERGYIYKMD